MRVIELGEHTLIHGDCLEVLPHIDQAEVDHVITDPPYGIALKNNCQNGQSIHRKERSYAVDSDHNNDAAMSVLRWCEEREYPVIAFASPWNPWQGEWRNLIVWDKGGVVGGGGDIKTCLKRTWELIQVARNGPMNGSRDVSVWRHLMLLTSAKDHICAKPVDLMVRLIERFTDPGQVIFDPFMGSGTTGIACIKTGRKFIGVEKDDKHFDFSLNRMTTEMAQVTV